MAGTWRNWMGNQSCEPREIFRPTTIEDLQFVVRTAAKEGRKVRAFGSGHSWMPLVPTDDFLVDIRGLNQLHMKHGDRTRVGYVKLSVQRTFV